MTGHCQNQACGQAGQNNRERSPPGRAVEPDRKRPGNRQQASNESAEQRAFERARSKADCRPLSPQQYGQ
jgi:hypothetical protein